MGAEQGKMQAGGRRGPSSPSGTGSVDASLQKRLQHGVAYNMKVIIRGAPQSGKTQLFRRLQAKTFDDAYTPTSQLQSATIHWSYNGTTPGMGGDNSTKVEVWDVVDKGQARESPKATGLRGKAKSLFGSKDPPVPNMVADASSVDVYKNTHVVVLMFDITKPETWDYVTKTLPDVPPAIHVLILANCHDLADTGRQVEETSIEEFARDQSLDRRKQGDGRVFKLNTSMKDCFGLSELYQYLSVPFLCLKRASLMETVKLLSDKIEETDREFEKIVGEQNYPTHLGKLEEGIARAKAAAEPPPPPEPHPSSNIAQGEPESSPDASPESPSEPTTRVKSVSFSNKPQEAKVYKDYDEDNFYASVSEASDESGGDEDSDSLSSESDNGMMGTIDDFDNKESQKAERKRKEKERLEKQKKREEKERQRKAQEKEERKKREAEERERLKEEQAKQEEEKKKQEEEEKEKENMNAERKAKFELVAASVDVGDEGMDDFLGGDVEEEGEGDAASQASVQEEEEVADDMPVRRRGMSEVIDDPVEAPVVRARGLSSMSRQSSAPGDEGSGSQSDPGSDPDLEGAVEYNEDFFDTFGEEQQAAKPAEAPAPAPASAVDAATLAAIEAMKKQMEQEAADAEANKSTLRPSYSGRLPKEKKEKKAKKEKGENGDKPKKPKKEKGEKAAKEPKEPGEKKKKKSEKGEKKDKSEKREKGEKKKKSKKGEE